MARAGWTPELQKRLHRPDPRARVIVQADVIEQAAVKQRRDHWLEADGSGTGFQFLSDGRVVLSPSTSVQVARTTSSTTVTDLDADLPHTVGAIVWAGTASEGVHLDAITAYLDPDPGGTTTPEVAEWRLDLYAVVRATSLETEVVPICQPVYVERSGASAGDVTFEFPAGREPQPKLWPAPVVEDTGTFDGRHPVTLVRITALDSDGNAASNVAWGFDDTITEITDADGNTLRSHDIAQVVTDTGGSPTTWGAATGSSKVPRMSVVSQDYTSATLSFTTNPLTLGAVPTGTVRFSFEDETPGSTTTSYEVLDDAGTTWVAVESGQTTDDLTGVGKRQSYSVRATLSPGALANQSPALHRMAVEEVGVVDFDGLADVSATGWQVDPTTLKGSICEATITALQDGNRDYRDKATLLLADNAVRDIAFRVHVGWKDAAGALQGILIDIFDVDDYTGEGAALRFVCVGRNARLSNVKLPPYDPASNTREAIRYENQSLADVYDDILGTRLAMDERFRGTDVSDTTLVTKRITNSTAIEELDAVAYLAGGAVITSQGRIRFVPMHQEDGGRVRAMFRSEDVIPTGVGPGLRGRVPEVDVLWDFDPETGDYQQEAVHKSADALLYFDPWRVDGEPESVADTVTQWIDTEALAQTVGERIVRTRGTGLILWSFGTTYAHPYLEPGDLVAIQTDRFAARDPQNSGRALRGKLWAIGRVVRVGNIAGSEFTVWVQRYSDIRGTATAVTRDRLAPGALQGLTLSVRTLTESETSQTLRITRDTASITEVWRYSRTVARDAEIPDIETVQAEDEPVIVAFPAAGYVDVTVAAPDPASLAIEWYVPYTEDLEPGVVAGPVRLDPLDPEPPEIQTDDSETATTGTQWVKVVDKGISITSVEFQTQVGSGTASGWTAATRTSGAASTVKGGTLGVGEYEQDVALAASRFSWITARVTLETGEVIHLGPFGFDRGKQPTFVSVEVDGAKVRVIADTDTESLKLERTDGGGTWVKEVDGFSHTFDVAKQDPNENPGISSGTWTLEASARSDPTTAVDANTLTTTKTVTVSDSGATTQTWLIATADAPASGDDDISIALKADAAVSGTEEARIYVRSKTGTSSSFGPWDNVTAFVTPSLSSPPTTKTTYLYDTLYPNDESDDGTNSVTYEVRMEIWDGGSAIDSVTETVKWYSSNSDLA